MAREDCKRREENYQRSENLFCGQDLPSVYTSLKSQLFYSQIDFALRYVTSVFFTFSFE